MNKKQQVRTESTNFLQLLFSLLRKYIFSILGVCGLIIGNILCK